MPLAALTCPVVLTGVSAKADGSLGVRFGTPELSPDEKAAFMSLMNRNLKLLLQPADEEPAQLKEIKGQFDSKTPGQRLRAVLFILHKQSGEQGEFEEFYRRQIEKFIDGVKEKLEPQ